MIDYNWIKGLKVGDIVIEHNRWNDDTIGVVSAVNKATIKVGNTLYNTKDGSKRGRDTYSDWCIMEATEERVARVKLNRQRLVLAMRMRHLKFGNLNMEQIAKFHAILDELGIKAYEV